MKNKALFCCIVFLCMILLSSCNNATQIEVTSNEEDGVVMFDGCRYLIQDDDTLLLSHCKIETDDWVIPENINGKIVTAIANDAFSGSVKTITIPDSIVKIEGNPFQDCNQLSSFSISSDHPVFAVIDGVLFDKNEKKLVCYPHAQTISSYSVPDGIQIIGAYAFSGCRQLSIINLPNTLKMIENNAFQDCKNTYMLEIPKGVTYIGDEAFLNCQKLLSIVRLPSSISYVGINPFRGCKKVEKIRLEGENEKYQVVDWVLYDKQEKRLVSYPEDKEDFCFSVPDWVEVIGKGSCASNKHLQTIMIPSSVNTIEDEALFGCSRLSNVQLTEGLEFIGEAAFFCCNALSKIEIPGSVKSIDFRAFMYCENLSEVKLYEGAETIGRYAFYACGGLKKVSIPKSVNAIGDSAFESSSNDVVIFVESGSVAETYCKENGIKYNVNSNTDWLTTP